MFDDAYWGVGYYGIDYWGELNSPAVAVPTRRDSMTVMRRLVGLGVRIWVERGR